MRRNTFTRIRPPSGDQFLVMDWGCIIFPVIRWRIAMKFYKRMVDSLHLKLMTEVHWNCSWLLHHLLTMLLPLRMPLLSCSSHCHIQSHQTLHLICQFLPPSPGYHVSDLALRHCIVARTAALSTGAEAGISSHRPIRCDHSPHCRPSDIQKLPTVLLIRIRPREVTLRLSTIPTTRPHLVDSNSSLSIADVLMYVVTIQKLSYDVSRQMFVRRCRGIDRIVILPQFRVTPTIFQSSRINSTAHHRHAAVWRNPNIWTWRRFHRCLTMISLITVMSGATDVARLWS